MGLEQWYNKSDEGFLASDFDTMSLVGTYFDNSNVPQYIWVNLTNVSYQVAVGTDLVCNPCTITTADGRTKTFDTSATIDCSSLANGTYKVLKDYGTGNLSTVSNLTISKATPSNPSSGDCWLDNSQNPLAFKIYDGSDWNVDNDKVYLGNVTISSGVITKVTNNVFNQFYSDEIIRINTDLDFSNIITVSTTSSTSSQSYTCLSDGMLFVSAHSYSSSSSSKDDIIFSVILSDSTIFNKILLESSGNTSECEFPRNALPSL